MHYGMHYRKNGIHQNAVMARLAGCCLIDLLTNRRPDVALAFFTSARHASPGAGSRFRAKGGYYPKTPVPAVFPLSVLSVLCFCERRLSHDPQCLRGFPGASLKEKLGGGGDSGRAMNLKTAVEEMKSGVKSGRLRVHR
jgi:hypothetical protein